MLTHTHTHSNSFSSALHVLDASLQPLVNVRGIPPLWIITVLHTFLFLQCSLLLAEVMAFSEGPGGRGAEGGRCSLPRPTCFGEWSPEGAFETDLPGQRSPAPAPPNSSDRSRVSGF